MAWRQALAAVLAVGLGSVLVVAPDALVRVHMLGRVPRDRGGSYGEDASLSSRWRRVVQAVGVVCVALGLYFGYQFLA